MKERTFYTFNLDLKRIIFLVVIFLVIVGYFFMLGRSIGKRTGAPEKERIVESDKTGKMPDKIPIKDSKSVKTEEGSKPEVVELPSNTSVSNPKDEKKSVAKKEFEDSTMIVSEKPEELGGGESLSTSEDDSKPKPKKKKSKKRGKAGVFTIQLGAFSVKESADKLKDKILVTNPEQKVNVSQRGDFWVVRIGRTKDKSELEKIISELDRNIAVTARIIKDR